MLDALRLSVGTLTIVPSGAITEIDRRTAARAMIIAPLHWGLSLPEIGNLAALGMLMAREMLLGLALGTSVMILLSGMQLSGQVISQMSGISLADVANPTFDTTVATHKARKTGALSGLHADPPPRTSCPGDSVTLRLS